MIPLSNPQKQRQSADPGAFGPDQPARCPGRPRTGKKKAGEALRGRCDSFVLETNVHFPTDINLLCDAMRKVITLTAQWCECLGMSDWRQHAYNARHVKRLMRTAQNKKTQQGQVTGASAEKRSPHQQSASGLSQRRTRLSGQGPPDPRPDRATGIGRCIGSCEEIRNRRFHGTRCTEYSGPT